MQMVMKLNSYDVLKNTETNKFCAVTNVRKDSVFITYEDGTGNWIERYVPEDSNFVITNEKAYSDIVNKDDKTYAVLYINNDVEDYDGTFIKKIYIQASSEEALHYKLRYMGIGTHQQHYLIHAYEDIDNNIVSKEYTVKVLNEYDNEIAETKMELKNFNSEDIDDVAANLFDSDILNSKLSESYVDSTMTSDESIIFS